MGKYSLVCCNCTLFVEKQSKGIGIHTHGFQKVMLLMEDCDCGVSTYLSFIIILVITFLRKHSKITAFNWIRHQK